MASIRWSGSWANVYASPEIRKKFANKGRLRKIIKDIGAQTEKNSRRNLKERFFENLLNRKEGDGFLIICLMDKLRSDFDGTWEPSSLNRILKEWEDQTHTAETLDTLYYVLSKRMVEPETAVYRKCALAMQSRRVRKGSNVNNRNRRIARRLIRHARELRIGNPEDQKNSTKLKFASVPIEQFDLWIELQAVLCNARFSNWKKTVDKAKALHIEIERNEASLCEHAHSPDIWLKWWTWDVRHRAAAVCRDKALFIKSKKNMSKLKEDAEENLRGYFDEEEGRPLDVDNTSSETLSTHKELKTVDEFIRSWVKFDERWEDARKYRRGGSRGEEDSEMKGLYDKFSIGLQRLNEYFLYGAPGRPKFVKHSYSTDEKQKRDRCRKILAEISHARMMLVLSDTHLYCYLLEILHRLLVYRMWWESINHPPRKEDELQEKGISICFEPKVAAAILEDIKNDMLEKHINKRWIKEIEKSIRCFQYLDEDSRPAPVVEEEAHEKLRKLLDSMEMREERYFFDTNYDEGEGIVCSIYGIPYPPPDKSAFDVMTPNRRPTGWTTTEISPEFRETLD